LFKNSLLIPVLIVYLIVLFLLLQYSLSPLIGVGVDQPHNSGVYNILVGAP
jgi:hypothetical protein